ncbi:MAG: DIP1984 family protein [Polyangiaceae bacterium]|nr:DIP1984 family protein [Polyangiaceae bacterium]
MFLSEALMERKDTKSRMEGLKKRLYAVARTEEGLLPPESPLDLLRELMAEVLAFESLVARIDGTNAATNLSDGTPLVSALIRRDMLRYRHLLVSGLADHAISSPSQGRYSAREIRSVPAVDVSQLRRDADGFAREGRVLDAEIQRANWSTQVAILGT